MVMILFIAYGFTAMHIKGAQKGWLQRDIEILSRIVFASKKKQAGA